MAFPLSAGATQTYDLSAQKVGYDIASYDSQADFRSECHSVQLEAAAGACGGDTLIVVKMFDGDDDTELALMQHDAYHDALYILVRACNRFASFAIAVLNDKEHDAWVQLESFDHRTLQDAHDLLAAAWRFSNDSRQGILPFSETASKPTPKDRWFRWLWEETSHWVNHPHIVRSVYLILTNQNNQIGYAAEAMLGLLIMDRFPLVPWKMDLREAHEDDCARSKQKTGTFSLSWTTPSKRN